MKCELWMNLKIKSNLIEDFGALLKSGLSTRAHDILFNFLNLFCYITDVQYEYTFYSNNLQTPLIQPYTIKSRGHMVCCSTFFTCFFITDVQYEYTFYSNNLQTPYTTLYNKRMLICWIGWIDKNKSETVEIT